MFIVGGLIMSASVGAFISLIFTSGIEKEWKQALVGIPLALAIGFGISGLLTLEHETDKATWNNGNCSCGYEWELIDIERTRHGSTIYYYDCGKIIELHTNFGK